MLNNGSNTNNYSILKSDLFATHILTMTNSFYPPLKEDSNGSCGFKSMRAKIVRSYFFQIKDIYRFYPNKKKIQFLEKFNSTKVLAYPFCSVLIFE